MTTQQKLEILVANGESQTLELKKSLSLIREGLETLCAMINSDFARGVVIFGIKPDGSPCGVEPGNLDKAQRSLSRSINEKFDPPIIAQIELKKLKGKLVLVLKAKKSPDVPFHEYDGRAWIRQGTENIRLSFTQKQRFIQGRRIIPASVDFSFHKIHLEAEFHRYSLVTSILLMTPKMQNHWRLNLFWPTVVQITKLKGLKKGDNRDIRQCRYIEIIRGDMMHPIFPGESILVIGPGKEAELEYLYNDSIWQKMENKPRDLFYKLYLENHSPVEGSVSFNNLNVF